mgnify:CR=1 FL=1
MLNIVYEICKKHNINESFNITIKNNQTSNRLFVSKSFFIKMYFGKKEFYYYNEIFIYTNLKKDFLPRLIAAGEFSGIKYIIIERIYAQPLFSIWHKLNDITRENIIMQMASILKEINMLNFDKKIDFIEQIELEYNNYIDKVIISNDLKNQIVLLHDKIIELLKVDKNRYLTYTDCHFNNFLYDGRKLYIIDFEVLTYSTLDFQLDSINRMVKNPKIEAGEKYSSNIFLSDYKNILKWLKKYYIDMFNFPHIEERLKFYSIVYNLRIMYKYNYTEEQFKNLI